MVRVYLIVRLLIQTIRAKIISLNLQGLQWRTENKIVRMR